jgi:hypothetical protein
VTVAERIIAAVQAKGNDARDLRDAAHEACHAIAWGVKKKWTRDNIHAKKPKRGPLARSQGVFDEISARAVEQLVCADLGVECWTIEKAATTCWFETLKNEGISLPSPQWIADCVRERMKSPQRAQARRQGARAGSRVTMDDFNCILKATCDHMDDDVVFGDVFVVCEYCKRHIAVEEKPSPAGKILFVISAYDLDWKPLIMGHEGFYIHEEIQNIGHEDVAALIPMPAEDVVPSKELEGGIFVWKGDVAWHRMSGGYESPPEYDMHLDNGSVRRAVLSDMDMADGFPMPVDDNPPDMPGGEE